MKIVLHRQPRGIAIVIVMVSIFVLAMLAGVFAYSMKVETKLASNSNNSGDLECLGRSGIEVARWVLFNERRIPSVSYDALTQVWAGGPGETNDPLAGFQMENIQVGDGFIRKITITDTERKYNINKVASPAGEQAMQKALILMGVDAGEIPTIIGSIQDWIDKDDDTHINGAESDYYQGMDPPYFAKNGPIDDLSELLYIKGITPEMYSPNAAPVAMPSSKHGPPRTGMLPTTPLVAEKLVDLFTPISNGRINVNTASATVLQMIPGIDENTAEEIVRAREEVGPFRNVNDIAANTSLNARGGSQITAMIQPYCTVQSSTFEVKVDVELGQSRRSYYALLVRNLARPQDIQILNMHWE